MGFSFVLWAGFACAVESCVVGCGCLELLENLWLKILLILATLSSL
ncbi:hypothetical protein [Helicobacter cinaedi]|nr:hypothetical protein [Helicobacter cinaedi]